jgi:signal transduction histidine kinase
VLPTEIVRTATFRLTLAVAGVFAVCTMVLFAFIYWQTAVFETQRIGTIITGEARVLAAAPLPELLHAPAGRLMDGRLASGLHRLTFVGLFAPDGTRVAGNLHDLPAGLPPDGRAHRLDGLHLADGTQTALAVARRLPGGQILVVGRNIAVLVELHQVVIHALLLGLIPATLLALAAGAVLSLRTVGRLRVLHLAIERIMHGGLDERLPAGGTRDDLDQLTRAMNRMLDEIERLVGEAKSVGDNIAHDLRTPLARVRTRLERGRRVARTREELCDVVDAAIRDLELTFGIVTALLRIGEIESGRRRAGFGKVDLAEIAQEVVEIYAPIAEERDVALTAEAGAVPLVPGDRDLLIEAVANLVDNAIKFTPSGGAVRIEVSDSPDGPALRIADTGPGIPAAERELVLRRFYRADRSRQVPGHGLGLSLVAAIVRLHDFRLVAGDGPGCVFTLLCASTTR